MKCKMQENEGGLKVKGRGWKWLVGHRHGS